MRGQDRLGTLHVGIAGQDHVGIGIAPADQRPLHVGQPLINFVNRLADPQPKVGRDLIVATPGRVQLAADVAEAIRQGLLDVHVDVFQFRAEREASLLNFPAYLAQGLLNLPAFIGREQANFGQHLGVGRRTLDVLRKQTAIEAHAFGELLNTAIGRHVKNTAPCLLRQIKPRTSNLDPDKIDNLLSLNDLRRIVNEAAVRRGQAVKRVSLQTLRAGNRPFLENTPIQ